MVSGAARHGARVVPAAEDTGSVDSGSREYASLPNKAAKLWKIAYTTWAVELVFIKTLNTIHGI